MSKALKDRIRIVFFDIDDTLYSKNAGLLSPGVEKAFLGLKRRGSRGAGYGGVLCRAYPHVGDLDDAGISCGTGADHA